VLVNPPGPCLLQTTAVDSKAGNEKNNTQKKIQVCVWELRLNSSCSPAYTPAQKFSGSEHITFGKRSYLRKTGRKKAGVGGQLPSFPLNSKVYLMTLFITWKEEWEVCLSDRYKQFFQAHFPLNKREMLHCFLYTEHKHSTAVAFKFTAYFPLLPP